MKLTAKEVIKQVITEEAPFLNEPFVDALATKITSELKLSDEFFIHTSNLGPSSKLGPSDQ